MNHLRYLDLLLEENKQVLYHTTLAKNVPLIIKNGIVPKKKGMTHGAVGQDVRVAIAIYAFENIIDAQRWAFRVEWDTKEKSAIIPFETNIKDWTVDTHWEAGLGRGKWLFNKKSVPPENILADEIQYPDEKVWKKLVKEV